MHDVIVNLFQTYLQISVVKIMMPAMLGIFLAAILLRFCLFYAKKKKKWFIDGLGVRIYRYLDQPYNVSRTNSFYEITEALMRKTFEELFVRRATQRKRKFDKSTTMVDRLFMIESGSKRLIHDTLLKVRYLKNRKHEPNFSAISKYVLSSNPIFNKLLGIFPINLLDDLLNMLPGLFIIGGILGTFIGIMGGLPELKTMDVTDIDSASATLNRFLSSMGFAMMTSVIGIFLSIAFTIFNTIFSFYGIYNDILESYTNSLEFIWKESLPTNSSEKSANSNKHLTGSNRMKKNQERNNSTTVSIKKHTDGK